MTAGGGIGGASGSRRLDVAAELRRGEWPAEDGWGWLYRSFDVLAPRGGALRRALCGYFWPGAAERAGAGVLDRLLGVRWFGRWIPTGGIGWRWLTGAKMRPYTLRGSSLGAAREFYYRTCVFEALHLPFLLALVALAGRQLALGRADLALEDSLVNLLFNVYPILHHRRTRGRIAKLLEAAVR